VTRFTGGTPSIGPAAGATAGQEIVNAAGVDAVYAHNQNLLTRLFSKLPATSVVSHTGKGTRGSGAIIRVSDYNAAAQALKEAGVIHDTRLGAVRVSFHLYNDETDVDAFAEAIEPHL